MCTEERSGRTRLGRAARPQGAQPFGGGLALAAGGGRVLPLLALVLLAAFAPLAAADPAFGILQFRVDHNLESPACLAAGSCHLEFDPPGDPSDWLRQIRRVSDLAVLHWDRGIPWLVFDVDPPLGADRVAYYDAHLDAPTVAWLEAFEVQFAALPQGYLAVSILSGQRDRLAPLHRGVDEPLAFATSCPDFSPGVQVTLDPGTGPVTFDLLRSYRNFVLYLAQKLGPDYVGLMVEANLIESFCPARAAGLYAFYRTLHDQVEAVLGSQPRLFATLTLPQLLAYERANCYAGADFALCGGPPAPAPQPASPEVCFPTNRGAIDALALGGRLDVLALSFYPDGLEMRSVSSELPQLRAFTLANWNGGGQCFATRSFGDSADPLAAIDRLGWSGPIAIAETSARSCATPLYFEVPEPGGGTTPMVFQAAGSPASQAAWVGHTYRAASARGALFFAHSFLRDYQPVGTWIAELGILPASLQALINTWPCSGFQDASGAWKPEMLAAGVPEPSLVGALEAGLLGLWAAAAIRARRRRCFSPVGAGR